jgi:hypothetical protein
LNSMQRDHKFCHYSIEGAYTLIMFATVICLS